jgi:hypothetical protein
MKEIPKITPPTILTKEINSKVVVFCDEGEEDWECFKKEFFWTEYGVITNIEFINLTIFESANAFEQSFDIFMFDWGGMSMGNSMLEHFIRRLCKMAEDNPSKDFILLSRFTNDAYRDYLENEHEKLFNVYTTDQWLETIKK